MAVQFGIQNELFSVVSARMGRIEDKRHAADCRAFNRIPIIVRMVLQVGALIWIGTEIASSKIESPANFHKVIFINKSKFHGLFTTIVSIGTDFQCKEREVVGVHSTGLYR